MRKQERWEEDEHDEAGCQVHEDLRGQTHLARLKQQWFLKRVIRLAMFVRFVFPMRSDEHVAEEFAQLR